MESQGWRAAAQLDVVEAGPLPCGTCVDAGSRFPCIIVSYRDQCNTQRACIPRTPPSRGAAHSSACCRGRAAPRRAPLRQPWPLQLILIPHSTPRTTARSLGPGRRLPPPAPAQRSTLDPPDPGIGVAASASSCAPRHERQHRRRRALGIVGFCGCGGGGVIAGGNGSGNGDMGTGGTGTGYGARGGASASAAATGAVATAATAVLRRLRRRRRWRRRG